MTDILTPTLAALFSRVTAIRGSAVPQAGDSGGLEADLEFADGTAIHLYYWRLRGRDEVIVSSFDHGGGMSGPPTDALEELRVALVGKVCAGVVLEAVTGDLVIRFEDGLVLQGFRLRRVYEDWEVRLADGDTYWSNMITP